MNDEFNLSDEGDFTVSEARLAELLFRYADDTCNEADEQALTQALLTLPDLRRRFVELALQRVALERILREETASQPFSPTGAPSSAQAERPAIPVLGFLGRTSSLLARPVFWSILLVAAGFYGAFALIAWNLRDGTLLRETDRNDLAVATIRATSQAEWSSDSSAISQQRAAINAGEPLQIRSGLVELQLKQGTTLLIEGPAEWTIDGDNHANLKHGKLVAKVPSRAVGFTLKTPTATIVDLGTEFAVAVDRSGQSETLVRRGEVEIEPVALGTRPNGSPRRLRLSAGQAVRVSATGLTAAEPADFRGFTRMIEFHAPRANSVAKANVIVDRALHVGMDAIDPAPRQITHAESSCAAARAQALVARPDFGVVQDWQGFVGWGRDPARTNILDFRDSRPDVEFRFHKVDGDDAPPGYGSAASEPRWATSGVSSLAFSFVGLQAVRSTHRLTISFGSYRKDGFHYDRAVEAVGFTLNNINGGVPPTRYRADFQNAAGESLFRSNWVEGISSSANTATRPNVFFAHAVAKDAPAENRIAQVVITEERRGGPGSGNQVGLDDFGFTIDSNLKQAQGGAKP